METMSEILELIDDRDESKGRPDPKKSRRAKHAWRKHRNRIVTGIHRSDRRRQGTVGAVGSGTMGEGVNESAMRNLYHYTNIPAVVGMLRKDALRFTFPGGAESDRELNKGRYFFLSTSRTKWSRYAHGGSYQSELSSPAVVVNLDGRALSAECKVFPVDYWQYGRKNSEDEERVVGNRQWLAPLGKFVDEIHVFVDKAEPSGRDAGQHNWDVERIHRFHDLDDLAREREIPIYFYTDSNAFKTQAKSKAVSSFKDLSPERPGFDTSEPDFEERRRFALAREEREKAGEDKFTDIVRSLIALYKGEVYEPNKALQKKYWDKLKYEWDSPRGIEVNDFSNNRKSNSPAVQELTVLLRKERIKSVREFLDILQERMQKVGQEFFESKEAPPSPYILLEALLDEGGE